MPAAAQNGTVMPAPKAIFYDNNGAPCDGCKLCAYASGTTTPQNTFSELTLTTANANPVILDSAGRATVYLSATSYKFVLMTAGTDATCATGTTLWSQDTVAAVNTALTNWADLTFQVDTNNDGTNIFSFLNGGDTEKAQINESGDVQFDGDLTIGDATEDDKDITFDGNAQDFYLCLDDSADDLVIGLGGTCGTTPALAIDENRNVTVAIGVVMATWPTTATAANANVADGAAIKLVTSLRATKRDIQPIPLDVARAVSFGLQGITYRSRIDDDQRPWPGFIAEDVELLTRDLAIYAPTGKLQSVAYDRVPAYFVPVLRDHESRILALEAQLLALETRLQALTLKLELSTVPADAKVPQ